MTIQTLTEYLLCKDMKAMTSLCVGLSRLMINCRYAECIQEVYFHDVENENNEVNRKASTGRHLNLRTASVANTKSTIQINNDITFAGL